MKTIFGRFPVLESNPLNHIIIILIMHEGISVVGAPWGGKGRGLPPTSSGGREHKSLCIQSSLAVCKICSHLSPSSSSQSTSAAEVVFLPQFSALAFICAGARLLINEIVACFQRIALISNQQYLCLLTFAKRSGHFGHSCEE